MSEKNWLTEWMALFSSKHKQKLQSRLVLLLVLGVVLLVISHYMTDKSGLDLKQSASAKTESEATNASVSKTASNDPTKSELEKSYESELATALNQMAGVSNVTVVVKLAASEKKVYQTNSISSNKSTEETDKNDGKRTIDEFTSDNKVVTIEDGGRNIPLVVQTEMPKVKGVLVVANGVGRTSTKIKVIEAITRVLEVPSFRVAVEERH